MADEDQKNELKSIYNGEIILKENEKIEKVKNLFNKLVVAEYARQVRDAYLDLAYAHLSAIKAPKDKKEPLITLAKYLVDRDF